MKRRTLAALLAAALMLALLAGCAGKTEPAPEEPEAPAQTAEAAPEAQEPAQEEAEAPVEEAPEEETPEEPVEEEPVVDLTIDLPICDELTTYTLWTGVSPDLSSYVTEISDFSVYQEMERRTNIHLDGVVVSAFAESEQFNLMIASGEYCDIINGMSSYTNGFDAAIEEEIIVDLYPLVTEYMPNYWAALQEDDSILPQCVTDNGAMGAFMSLYVGAKPFDSGALIRKDWLDKLDMAAPETYDEVHDMLMAFKTELGADAALIVPADGTPGDNCLLAGYGVTEGWYQIDGQLSFGPLQEGYKEYYQMMNSWISDGLIWDEFLNLTDDRLTDFSTILADRTGMWFGGIQDMSTLNSQANDPNFRCYALADTVKNHGDMNHLGGEASYVNGTTWAVSTACEDYEPICKYIDYMYSEEGTILCNYGIEGEAHYIGDDGKPHLSELVTNNPDGLPYRVTIALFCFDKMSSAPFKLDNSKSYTTYSDDQMAAMEIWGSTNDGEYTVSRTVTLTAEESEEYTKIYADIETYMEENLVKFLVGDLSFDQWDAFTSQIESMNIQRCQEIQQQAFDRAYSR